MKQLHPTPQSSEPEAVRRELVTRGYVYLPQYLDTDEVRNVQHDLTRALHDVGWLIAPDELRVTDQAVGFTTESFRTVYPAVQRLESFHRLAHTTRLWALMEQLLGRDIFCHPAKVIRLAGPTGAGRYATKAHQDFVVQHVSTDALTAWIPVTPCNTGCQGLRILPGSHRQGFRQTDNSVGGARPLYLAVDAADPEWATADFELGDLVIFHSLTVHGGGPNETDRIRLSADVRYQLRSDPLRQQFAHPHGWPRTPDWDTLCVGWESRDWVDLPSDVELVWMPEDVTYEQFLAELVAPLSRLLNANHEDQEAIHESDD